MTFITHGFRVSVISDVRERVRDLASPLRFMLRRSSLVECVSVLHGTYLQCAENKYIHQYVKPCEENHRYTFLTIKSLLRSHITCRWLKLFLVCGRFPGHLSIYCLSNCSGLPDFHILILPWNHLAKLNQAWLRLSLGDCLSEIYQGVPTLNPKWTALVV